MKAILGAALLAGAVFFSACAGISGRAVQKPEDAQRAALQIEAAKLVASLAGSNRGLERFKGTGRFRIWQAEKMLSARVAWIGSYPDKLRIAVLNAGGQPTASLATDGRFVYMLSHARNEFYKKRATNPTLQQLVSIPISISDIIAILTGRIPVREHDLAELTADENSSGYILTLKGRWRGVSEKVHLDGRKQAVVELEMFGFSGDLLYRAAFQGRKLLNGYEVPAKIIVSDARESRFELEIENYWTDATLSPSTFVLYPPDR